MRFSLTFLLATMVTACAIQTPSMRMEVPSQIPQNIATELQKIGRIVSPPPIEVLYRPLHEKEPYA
jgi:hypothetical protein